jgi:hypothetical protein
MQVINAKERGSAKWRFALLFIIAAAIPSLLIINAIHFGKVENHESQEYVNQLRKRDIALSDIVQLAGTLTQMQVAKPPYMKLASNQPQYDQLRFRFETDLDRLKRQYYEDTVLYKPHHELISYIETNYVAYDKISSEFENKVIEASTKNVTPMLSANRGGDGGGARGGGSSGDAAQLIRLETQLQIAQNKATELQHIIDERVPAAERQVDDIRRRANEIESNMTQFGDVIKLIEADCNGIQRKSDKNLELKKNILSKINSLKDQLAKLKSGNNTVLSMLN